jgi:hypothetical protein
MDPGTADIALTVLTDILGPVEVIATGPPDSPCLSPAAAPAAAHRRPCTDRAEARYVTGAGHRGLPEPQRTPS